jgi:hypothetical protein
LRNVANYLGLPVSVMERLREIGLYVTTTDEAAWRGRVWSAHDLRVFLSRGLSLAPAAAQVKPADTVSLGTLMRRKLRDAAAKADIVAAAFDGRLAVLGRDGDNLAGLLVQKSEAEQFIHSKRLLVERQTYSLPEAADATGLDSTAVANAIHAGLLTGVPVNGRLRVSMDSIVEFNRDYVTLVRVAKSLDTTPQRLWRLCRKAGVPVVPIRRSTACESLHPVLRRNHETTVLELWKAARN